MKKLELDLELVLPKDAAACDACIERVQAALRKQPGIDHVHIDRGGEAQARLCVHYQPGAIRLERVRALVEESGAELAKKIAHLSVAVTGLRHERQARLVEAALAKQSGVLGAAIALGAERVFIEFDPSRTSRNELLRVLEENGLGLRPEAAPVDASKEEHDEHDHKHGGPFGARSELIFSLMCGVLTAIGWALTRTTVSRWIPTGLFAAAYLSGGWFTVKEVLVALRGRKFEIDFLMLIAAAGAAAIGNWFEGALLLFLFTLGHALEGFAMRRARKAIEALSKLVPATALRLGADGEQEVPVAQLAVGDRILIKPNTRVPADGFVEQGESSVNQAPITGESVPVDKRPARDIDAALANPTSIEPESRLFAGSINGSSALVARVTKAAADSTLARVVKMVAEAETQKSATQLFTDRFERIFVPIILGVVVLLMFGWVVRDETFAQSFYRAMAVLVAASPCALAIATPSAVLAGVARAARGGVLIKGGAHLESLGQINAVAFDKTGTLTEGKPRLTDVRPLTGVDEQELLRVALAVEKQSDHPLARAITAGATTRLAASAPAAEATSAKAVTGFGVEADLDGRRVRIGKPGMFTGASALPADAVRVVGELETAGRTVMVVQAGDSFLGVLGVIDTPRESARPVIAELHALGVAKTIMLTGDNQRVADAVAKEVGVREARGDLLPEDKVAAISALASGSSRVAMVGDGVNDAPAMASASVGIAMGAGGSDVALETADVALMGDDLRALPFAVGLSRAARRIIQQNLWASLGMVAFLIPATLLGFAGIGLAVSLHEGSTLLVVANALRLLAFRDSRAKKESS